MSVRYEETTVAYPLEKRALQQSEGKQMCPDLGPGNWCADFASKCAVVDGLRTDMEMRLLDMAIWK